MTGSPDIDLFRYALAVPEMRIVAFLVGFSVGIVVWSSLSRVMTR